MKCKQKEISYVENNCFMQILNKLKVCESPKIENYNRYRYFSVFEAKVKTKGFICVKLGFTYGLLVY